MKKIRISAFLLERYHIGEVTFLEKRRVEKALGRDPSLAAALAELKLSNQNFCRRFPRERFFGSGQKAQYDRTGTLAAFRFGGRFRSRPVLWGLCAAAMLLVIALPLFVLKNPSNDPIDRIKGTSGENSAELNVYLKGNSAGNDIKLPDHTAISAGNTIQLAYRLQPDISAEQYGVIFSIDGRSVVTMHYPYKLGQSTRLVSGKLVPLDEAYTLDDAPDYEMFFFVVGNEPLETMNILNTARNFAPLIAENPQEALQHGAAAFKNREVQIITLLKE